MENILILGATSDIAEACCYAFANDKKNLILTGRDGERLNKIASDLRIRHNINVHTFLLDVSNPDAIEYTFHKISELGFNGVLLAYGYLGDQLVAQSNTEEQMKIIHTNFTSAVTLLEKCAAHLEAKKNGFICAISSVAGDRGRQSNYLYGSAKAGLSTYLEGLRNRLYHANIHVLTVKPGFVLTKMTNTILKKKTFLVALPNEVAKDISKAIKKKKNVLYTKWIWRFVMFVISSIPEFVFKRLRL